MRIPGGIAALLCLICSAHTVRAEPVVLRGATMGTTYQIKFAPSAAADHVEQLHSLVEEVLAEVDRQMSTWRPDSELSRFNRAPAGEWFAVSNATAKVTAAAQAISQKTGGALDVTVNPLVKLWNFGPPNNRPQRFKPPAEEKLNALRTLVGYDNLEVRIAPPALRKRLRDVEVDLSAIAPGYAIDRLADLLQEHGVRDFMIELGGEVRAAGRRPDGRAWRVGIHWPLAGKPEMRSIPLSNLAVATAGDYQKFFEFDGRRYSHIIDPSTGRPVEHELASVTVVADTCLAADGWDTPLLVLGPERGYECAERNGIAALFIARGDVNVRATSAWESRFEND